MLLPESTRKILEELATGIPLADLRAAAEELGSGYREGRATSAINFDDLHALAYGIVRMPATYSAMVRVLAELADLAPDFAPTTHRDLGAGPGTAVLATRWIFPELDTHHLVERDPSMRRLGEKLLASGGRTGSKVEWSDMDINDPDAHSPADLVTLSYSLVEIDIDMREEVLKRAYESCGDVLVILEPGTKAGFEAILHAREVLASQGAHLLAPCPHAGPCPMAGTESWCHFAERLPRTRLHLKVKGATLGYEDEKYSYLVCTRTWRASTRGRITRPPAADKAGINLEICLPEGLVSTRIPKKEKTAWKTAKKLTWGSHWEPGR